MRRETESMAMLCNTHLLLAAVELGLGTDYLILCRKIKRLLSICSILYAWYKTLTQNYHSYINYSRFLEFLSLTFSLTVNWNPQK